MQIIAHRGASGAHPEHTIGAYEAAVAEGADGVECDIRLTADGHLICMHDRTLGRTTDGSGPVGAKTLADIRRLNAGTWEKPQPVLEFDTFLEFAVANPDIGLFIETKHPVTTGLRTERVLRERLRHFGLDEDPRTRIISFAARSINAVGDLLPNLERIQLVKTPGARTAMQRYLGGPTAMGVDMYGARRDPMGMMSWNLPLYCWLAKTDVDVTYAKARGIDWLATDWPARARAALDAMPKVGGFDAAASAAMNAGMNEREARAARAARAAGAVDAIAAQDTALVETLGTPLSEGTLAERDTGLRPEDAVGFDRDKLRPEDVALPAEARGKTTGN
ncbi:glycerophosphodiester phosphodiesterase [uncultured Corynebacterium sp.]|uniref:glycerophosphodiester phosphodiesterase n=1 Tax=uncultured Corynebacterium sp. TaxID=159447 RepID=UPI0025FF4DD9|nr:glycerophosphodiester phosphodiesterase [uncultured Corynebacterium sp.]